MKLQTRNTREHNRHFRLGAMSHRLHVVTQTSKDNSNHCTSALGAVPVANITVYFIERFKRCGNIDQQRGGGIKKHKPRLISPAMMDCIPESRTEQTVQEDARWLL